MQIIISFSVPNLCWFISGRRQRDTRSDIGSDCRRSGACVDRRLTLSREVEGVLWALTGAGEDRAKAAGTARGRKTQSHSTLGDATSFSQTVSRDFGVRAKVRRVQGETRSGCCLLAPVTNWFSCYRWKRPPYRTTSAIIAEQWAVSVWTTTTSRPLAQNSRTACLCFTPTQRPCWRFSAKPRRSLCKIMQMTLITRQRRSEQWPKSASECWRKSKISESRGCRWCTDVTFAILGSFYRRLSAKKLICLSCA